MPEKPSRGIVKGQEKIDPIKIQRSKELRSSMTEAEGLVWEKLRGSKFEGLHFRRHQVIEGFIVDFFCNARGLVVEVDGEIHAGQTEYDFDRDRVLTSKGLVVLRFRNEEVQQDLNSVLDKISSACRRQINNDGKN